MKWINAEAKIRMQIYDEEHEEYITKQMTVEEALDAYTEDGCPTTVEAEPVKHGHWIKGEKIYPDMLNDTTYGYWCSECHHVDVHGDNVEVLYCWHCGAKMDEVNE